MKIEGGRLVFWQWDTGQRLIVEDADCTEVHFYIKRLGTTEAHQVYDDSGIRAVDVPDALLQTVGPLVAFAYIRSESGSITTRAVSFNVVSRPKPPDYVQGTFISNQDIEVKENGVYTPGEGFTGIGLVTVDVHASPAEEVAF